MGPERPPYDPEAGILDTLVSGSRSVLYLAIRPGPEGLRVAVKVPRKEVDAPTP